MRAARLFGLVSIWLVCSVLCSISRAENDFGEILIQSYNENIRITSGFATNVQGFLREAVARGDTNDVRDLLIRLAELRESVDLATITNAGGLASLAPKYRSLSPSVARRILGQDPQTSRADNQTDETDDCIMMARSSAYLCEWALRIDPRCVEALYFLSLQHLDCADGEYWLTNWIFADPENALPLFLMGYKEACKTNLVAAQNYILQGNRTGQMCFHPFYARLLREGRLKFNQEMQDLALADFDADAGKAGSALKALAVVMSGSSIDRSTSRFALRIRGVAIMGDAVACSNPSSYMNFVTGCVIAETALAEGDTLSQKATIDACEKEARALRMKLHKEVMQDFRMTETKSNVDRTVRHACEQLRANPLNCWTQATLGSE